MEPANRKKKFYGYRYMVSQKFSNIQTIYIAHFYFFHKPLTVNIGNIYVQYSHFGPATLFNNFTGLLHVGVQNILTIRS